MLGMVSHTCTSALEKWRQEDQKSEVVVCYNSGFEIIMRYGSLSLKGNP